MFFAGLGAAGYEAPNQTFRVWTNDGVEYTPLIGVEQDPDQPIGILRPVFGPTRIIDGFKLIDGRASYGVGLETFALGFPIHFDWSWRTMFNREYEDAVFQFQGLAENMRGSDWFRKVQFAVWIGYNF